MITFYQDKRGKWRWRIMGKNNEIIAASSQGFVRRIDARGNLTRVANLTQAWKEQD